MLSKYFCEPSSGLCSPIVGQIIVSVVDFRSLKLIRLRALQIGQVLYHSLIAYKTRVRQTFFHHRETKMENFDVIRNLGRGSFGQDRLTEQTVVTFSSKDPLFGQKPFENSSFYHKFRVCTQQFVAFFTTKHEQFWPKLGHWISEVTKTIYFRRLWSKKSI